MTLRVITGKKRPADFARDRQDNVNDPMMTVYRSGKAQTNIRCANMLAFTGITDPEQIGQVKALAATLPDGAPWTKELVAAICQRVGKVPFPRNVKVEHLEGAGTLLLKVNNQEGDGVVELTYAKGTNRPSLHILPALKDENIHIAEGMCLDVPVALVLDEGFLKLELNLHKGTERALKKSDDKTDDEAQSGEES